MNRKVLAEFLGSLLLAALVIGSGIAAQRLSPGGCRPATAGERRRDGRRVVRAHPDLRTGQRRALNPVVSLVDAVSGGLSWRELAAYVPAQLIGCVTGAVLANVMFDADAVSIGTTQRASLAHGVSEVVATVGLLLVIFLVGALRTGRAGAGRGRRLPRRPRSSSLSSSVRCWRSCCSACSTRSR